MEGEGTTFLYVVMYIEEVTVLSLSTENRQSIYEYFAVIQNLFKISFCIILDGHIVSLQNRQTTPHLRPI